MLLVDEEPLLAVDEELVDEPAGLLSALLPEPLSDLLSEPPLLVAGALLDEEPRLSVR